MRHRSTEALFRYWDGLRGERSAPKRTEIDPRAIAGALCDVFLLEGPAHDFRFRLAGSRLVEALGRGLTGTPYEEIWSPRVRLAAMSALWTAAEDNEPMLIGIRIADDHRTPNAPDARASGAVPASSIARLRRDEGSNVRDPGGSVLPERRQIASTGGELLLLPLAAQAGIGARLVGALALFEHPAMPLAAARDLDLTGSRMLGRAARPGRGTGLLPASLASTVIGRRGHLVVMRGLKEPE